MNQKKKGRGIERHRKLDDANDIIARLKFQVEESKNVYEDLKVHFTMIVENYSKMEEEIVNLRMSWKKLLGESVHIKFLREVP